MFSFLTYFLTVQTGFRRTFSEVATKLKSAAGKEREGVGGGGAEGGGNGDATPEGTACPIKGLVGHRGSKV